MEEQIYNKNGKVNRYTNLDDILKLNLSDKLREEFKTKFKKRVYFEYKESCTIGKLVGIEINEKLSAQYYIIDTEDKRIYISCNNSLTLL